MCSPNLTFRPEIHAPNRPMFSIALDPSRSIPVVLKDVLPAVYDPTSRVNDLLAGAPNGPPGKIYAPEVLQFVKKGGSCARIVLTDETNPNHVNYFNQLRLELENGKLVSRFSFVNENKNQVFTVSLVHCC